MRSGHRKVAMRRPFHTLSRRERGNAGIRLKAKIMRTRSLYGGHFTSHLWLEEPEESPARCQWFDFFVFGTRQIHDMECHCLYGTDGFLEQGGRAGGG